MTNKRRNENIKEIETIKNYCAGEKKIREAENEEKGAEADAEVEIEGEAEEIDDFLYEKKLINEKKVINDRVKRQEKKNKGKEKR